MASVGYRRRRTPRTSRVEAAPRGARPLDRRAARRRLQRRRAIMMTIEEFGKRLRAREITSEQVTAECLQRIEATNPELNAFILVMGEEAQTQAREADRELADGRDRGPLHGVPISVKDLYDIRGTATTAPSPVPDPPLPPPPPPSTAHLPQPLAISPA